MAYDKIGTTIFWLRTQFWVDGGDHRIRSDVLLFVNGIRLVNIEAKTTARGTGTTTGRGRPTVWALNLREASSSTIPMYFVWP